MDFIDWCHRVLRTLDDEKLNATLSDHRLLEILFAGVINDNTRIALNDALLALRDVGLANKGKFYWKITTRGRPVLSDPTALWTAICQQNLDSDEATMLRLINSQSPKQGTNPDRVWLERSRSGFDLNGLQYSTTTGEKQPTQSGLGQAYL